MEQVKQRMATGAAWMILQRLADQSLGLVGIVILARLLTPADFAIVAMASAVVEMTELLRMFGFDWAVIQKQARSRVLYDTAWTLNVLFASLTTVVLVVLALPAAKFFQEPRLPLVMTFLAMGSLARGFENIGVVAFRRDLDFAREFRYRLAVRMTTFLVTIAFALPMRSYWALVAGALTGQIAGTVYSFVLHPYRPRLSLAGRTEIFAFSSWLLTHNLFEVGIRRSADFLLGRLASATSLGLFRVSYQISIFPVSELAAPINSALMPGYSVMSWNSAMFRSSFARMVQVSFLFTIPAGIGMAATAELIAAALLGQRWAGAAPFIQILGLYGSITAIESNVSMAYVGMGRPRLLSYLTIAQFLLLVPLQWWFIVRMGPEGAAWAHFVSVFVLMPAYFIPILRTVGIPFVEFAGQFWRPATASAVMFVVVRTFVLRFPDVSGTLAPAVLLVAIAVGLMTYSATIFALWAISSRPDGGERVVITRLLMPVMRRMLSWSAVSP